MQGGLGDDWVEAGPGNDELDGGDGADVLIDGAGDDQFTGDLDADTIFLGPGADEVYSEEAGDTIYVLDDGQRDDLYCQGDLDTVVFVGTLDPLDVIHTVTTGGCETIVYDALPPAGWPY